MTREDDAKLDRIALSGTLSWLKAQASSWDLPYGGRHLDGPDPQLAAAYRRLAARLRVPEAGAAEGGWSREMPPVGTFCIYWRDADPNDPDEWDLPGFVRVREDWPGRPGPGWWLVIPARPLPPAPTQREGATAEQLAVREGISVEAARAVLVRVAELEARARLEALAVPAPEAQREAET